MGVPTAEFSQTGDVATGASPVVADKPLRAPWPLVGAQDSAAWQSVAIVIATVAIAAIHWENDGLWFQGDSPRHAANGLFLLDLARSMPTNPIGFALSYYARYPAITLGAYPPLFYVIEALAFAVAPASPHVAKVLVLAFSVLGGVYTMRYGRRWIGPVAGWAGLALVASPGFILYSNAVLLNVPATALGMAALYHFRSWLDTHDRPDRNRFIGFAVAAVLTYYPVGLMVIIGLVWLLLDRSQSRSRYLLWIPVALGVMVAIIALALPGYFMRNLAPSSRFLEWPHWLTLFRRLSRLTGVILATLGGLGFVIGLVSREQRKESARLLLGGLAATAGILLTTWSDPRYLLMLTPVLILAVFLGLTAVANATHRSAAVMSLVAPLTVCGLAAYSTVATPVPSASGFREVAEYLREQGPNDSVLYAGYYDGVFAFYVRALDPFFERRVVLWRRALAPGMGQRISPEDARAFIETQSGCQWIAVEIDAERLITRPMTVLSAAVDAPGFELVRSFPLDSVDARRVDLYRLKAPATPVGPVDLWFPLFSDRVFKGVEPIKSRR